MKNETTVYPAATMTPATTPHDSAEAYALVEKLVFHQVHKFKRRYGGDVDELVGEANLAFVKCHEQFIAGQRKDGKPHKYAFATTIRLSVWYGMLDNMRKRLRRKRIAPMVCMGEECEFPARLPEWDVTAWIDELGDDAQHAAELVLHPPDAIETTVAEKGGQPRNYHSTVRAYLLKELKWSTDRVNVAFAEIRRALG